MQKLATFTKVDPDPNWERAQYDQVLQLQKQTPYLLFANPAIVEYIFRLLVGSHQIPHQSRRKESSLWTHPESNDIKNMLIGFISYM